MRFWWEIQLTFQKVWQVLKLWDVIWGKATLLFHQVQVLPVSQARPSRQQILHFVKDGFPRRKFRLVILDPRNRIATAERKKSTHFSVILNSRLRFLGLTICSWMKCPQSPSSSACTRDHSSQGESCPVQARTLSPNGCICPAQRCVEGTKGLQWKGMHLKRENITLKLICDFQISFLTFSDIDGFGG